MQGLHLLGPGPYPCLRVRFPSISLDLFLNPPLKTVPRSASVSRLTIAPAFLSLRGSAASVPPVSMSSSTMTTSRPFTSPMLPISSLDETSTGPELSNGSKLLTTRKTGEK